MLCNVLFFLCPPSLPFSLQCPRCMQCDTKFDFIRRKVCFVFSNVAVTHRKNGGTAEGKHTFAHRKQRRSLSLSCDSPDDFFFFFFSPYVASVCVSWHRHTLRPLCWLIFFSWHNSSSLLWLTAYLLENTFCPEQKLARQIFPLTSALWTAVKSCSQQMRSE